MLFLMMAQVSLLCWYSVNPMPHQAPTASTLFSPTRLFCGYQTLAAMHWALSLLFNFLWRGVDPSSMLVSELQMYIMTGWSYWLLGAAHSLMMRDSVPIGVQIMALTFHRFNCACLEFNFTYLLQCRLSLLETGLGMKMGVGRVRRIRRVFLILQLSLDVVRGYLQTSSQLAVDWSSAIYHLVAGSGVLCTLYVCLQDFDTVIQALEQTVLPDQCFAKLEKEWSLKAFRRMALAVKISCTVSSASHLLCIPPVLLVHGSFRPILVPAYHLLDIVGELVGLIFIVGILKPQMPDIKPEIHTMRGTCKLKRDLSNTEWNVKVQELAHRSIDLENLLDFYDKLGGETMKHFDPFLSTTADVVRQAVIPLSRMEGRGFAYTDVLASRGKLSQQMPDCMVTHTWSGLFLHLVAAIVSDALRLDEYHQIASKMSSGKLIQIKQKLAAKGVLHNRYWICCFCVNQHASICNGVGEAPSDPAALARWERNRRDTVTGQLLSLCDCKEPKVLNDQPDKCELNKFHSMMLWLQQQKPNFRQLVVADGDFKVFERAWCVAELVAAHDADIPQRICLYSNSPFDFDEEDLSAYAKLASISVVSWRGFLSQQAGIWLG
ncbi:Uncharacterized protein SCF082_LOCUS9227 [Durusdinium trenchii]|uniref:Uncharacterized protein n=1 Tax=Durusdinium trenchii TaxID=1381693 RepID=A0ABP0IXV9_9DINO